MPVVARADLLYAVIGHLLTFPELTSLIDSAAGWQPGKGSGARIAPTFQDGWRMPTKSVWLKKSGGPAGDYEAGLHTTRLDARCYGATGFEADQVWAMLDAILVPATGERFVSFTRGGCRVVDIRPEAGESSDRERDTRYPYVFRPYLVDWWGVAA